MNTYTPSDFIAKISANELPGPEPAVITIVGLVKYDSEKPQSIQFSFSSSCQQWLAVPVDLIESIDHLASVACKDHQHPLVKVTFKRPDAARSDLVFLFGAVSQLQGTIRRISDTSKSGAKVIADGGDCYWQIVDGKVTVCCGDPPECTGVAIVQ